MKKCNAYRYARPAAAIAIASLSFPAVAVDFKLGDDIEAKVTATVTAGTMVRTESPDPGVYGTLSAARVGVTTGQLGANAGSSDLNFKKGQAVSTVIKGVADLELKRNDMGVFARVMAWEDWALKNGNRPYGNIPNAFAQGAPLSDSGFDPAAKFTNILVTDAYVFGKTKFDNGTTIDGRVGRQTLVWGVSRFTGGGINVINPLNIPAQQRPGALPQEGRIPVGMVYANIAAGKAWGADAFIQYEFRPTVLAGCGTFYGIPNFAPSGCNFVSVLPTLDDPTALAAGRYPHRNADIDARDSGQYGVSLRYNAAGLNTNFRGYAMQYHNRMPSIRVTNANVAGGYGAAATTRLTDPNGLKYGMIYAEDIHLYGLSFDTKVDPTLRIYGEVAYRPNQSLNLNASDLLAAFFGRAATSTLNLAKGTNAIAPGGTFDGYDRFKVTTGSLGASKIIPKALGAEQVILSGEIGWSHVASLPDAGFLRYGRSDDWGGAQAAGVACVDTTAAQKACAYDGFVTSNAWGYRLRLAANYSGALFGATLTPSVSFASDVSGYSYDGTFLKDRRILRPGIRADWDKKYFAEAQYTRISGGAYNNVVDRDNLTLVVGASF